MSRLNQVLTVLLVLQILVVVVVFWPEQSIAQGQQLFDGLGVDQIVGLTIRDESGQEITMNKGSGGWVIPAADDFPVQEDKVLALLDNIVGLRADRMVTRTDASHKRLKVADEDFQRLIEFELDDGSRHKLYLGTAPRFQVLHVRAEDQNEVYLALGMSASDAGAGVTAWIDTDYFTVPQDQIVALTMENENGRFEFAKDDAGNWIMENLPPGETLVENNVRSMVARISTLRMLRPLGKVEEPSYGFDEPRAIVTLQTRDEDGNEKTYIVRFGDLLEDEKGVVVKSATSPYYVLMAEYAVRDFWERSIENFIEIPPTPTPEPPLPDVTPTP